MVEEDRRGEEKEEEKEKERERKGGKFSKDI